MQQKKYNYLFLFFLTLFSSCLLYKPSPPDIVLEQSGRNINITWEDKNTAVTVYWKTNSSMNNDPINADANSGFPKMLTNYSLTNLNLNTTLYIQVMYNTPFSFNSFLSEEKHITIGSSDWTIMVYMAGANNLETYALADIKEMESSQLAGKDIPVIILLDRIIGYNSLYGNWKDTRLFELGPSLNQYEINSKEISSTELGLTIDNTNEELNMGDPNTLRKFISFCKKNYTATNYMLILWNHGDGYRSINHKIIIDKAIAWDDESSDPEEGANSDALYSKELYTAISNESLNLIYMDACLMGMVEIAYQLRNVTDCIVYSETEISTAGGNYNDIFSKIADKTLLSTKDIANILVRSFANQYLYSDATITAVDTRKIKNLKINIDNFSDSLQTHSIDTIFNLRLNTMAYYRYSTTNKGFINNQLYTYIDLYDFANGAEAFINNASKLKNAINEVIITNYSRNPASHGLSIYFEQCEGANIWWNKKDIYTNRTQFGRESRWSNFLKWYYLSTTNISYFTNKQVL